MTTDATMDNFFQVMNGPDPTKYHKVDWLMANVFCPNNDPNNPTIPCVGITDHGPQFHGATDVSGLFHQLFTSFPDLTLTPAAASAVGAPLVSAPRLYSHSTYTPPTIGIQTNLFGTYTAPWFPDAGGLRPPHFSPPLSTTPADGSRVAHIPACAVFIFGDVHNPTLISQLAIYLDRYRLSQQLRTGAPSVTIGAAGVSRLVELLSSDNDS